MKQFALKPPNIKTLINTQKPFNIIPMKGPKEKKTWFQINFPMRIAGSSFNHNRNNLAQKLKPYIG